MSEQANWQDGNSAYLTAALNWLRLLLERQAQRQARSLAIPPAATTFVTTTTSASTPVRRGGLFRRTENQPTIVSSASPVISAASASLVTDEMVQEAAAQMEAAEKALTEPPALVELARQLGLSQFEREVLLLSAALDLDTRIATLCARAQDDPARAYPTFALALTLFDQPSWDVMSPQRPLRYWRLLEINQPAAQPLTISALRADERIVSCIKGLNYLDDRLLALVTPLDGTMQTTALPPSQLAVVEKILAHWRQAVSAGANALPVVQLIGADSQSKQLIAAHVAAWLKAGLYRLPAELLPTTPGDLDTLARLWQRESRLLPLVLFLDAQELDSGDPEQGHSAGASALLARFLGRSEGFFFLNSREVYSTLGNPNLVLDVDKPTQAEQQAAWREALDEAAGDNPALLAAEYNLNTTTISQLAQVVLSQPDEPPGSLSDRLWEACRLNVRPRLDALAERLEPKVSWSDLVLPPDETATLRQLADQVSQRSKVYEEWGFARRMSRGLGITALFAGESGTGKTLAAEVIANELKLNLYRIDLSAVISKYIGETEKNLRRVFDAAEVGGVLLFFDEADSIFGKRSEVKDSHDRYANIEINYLLQRMEAYRGLAILATNMKQALDTAFMRRLRFVITFPFPGLPERKRMWEKAFPPGVPTEGLDYDRLARFNLTGGSIHNLALNAAFRAAQAGSGVTMPMVLAAARAEYRKLERPINEADFR